MSAGIIVGDRVIFYFADTVEEMTMIRETFKDFASEPALAIDFFDPRNQDLVDKLDHVGMHGPAAEIRERLATAAEALEEPEG